MLARVGRPTSYGPVAVFLCVSLAHRYCIETAARIELVYGTCFPDLRYTMLYMEIRVSPELRVLSSGTLSQSLDLENLAARPVHRRRARYKQATAVVCCIYNTCRRRRTRHVLSTVDDDR